MTCLRQCRRLKDRVYKDKQWDREKIIVVKEAIDKVYVGEEIHIGMAGEHARAPNVPATAASEKGTRKPSKKNDDHARNIPGASGS
jgi:hypothetical protein